MRRAFCVLALATLVVGLAVPAANAGQVQVSGVQTALPDELIGTVYTLRSEVTADSGKAGLDGQWYTPVFDVATNTELSTCKLQKKTVQCRGTEWFDGFLDRDGDGVEDDGEPSGTLTFSFEYSGSASGNGRCHHPITGGTEDFEFATGQLTFKDRIGACGELVTTYKGHIDVRP